MIQDNKQIQGLIPPDPIEYWPPQPGWYIILAVILIVIIFIVWLYLKHRSKNAYRFKALKELKHIAKTEDDHDKLKALNLLLKVTAIHGFGREHVAHLTGRDWLEFLSQSSKPMHLDDVLSNILLNGPYRETPEAELDNIDFQILVEQSKIWIKTHKVK